VIPYSRDLAAGAARGLWNPHHLAAHPLAWIIGRAWCAASGAEWDLAAALLGHRVLSALGGASAVCVLLSFARRVAPRGVAFGLSACFALSAGTWLYSAVGETYMPAYAATGALLARAAEDRLGLRPASALRLGVLLLLAVLLRQDSVLVVPALFVLARPSVALRATLGAGVAALAVYSGAHLLAAPDVGLLPWLRGLADTGLWGRAPGPRELSIAAALSGAAIAYGVYFAWAPWKLGIGLLGLCTLAAGAVPLRTPAPPARRAVLGLLLFVLVRFGFLAWWQPSNMEYHTGSVLPLLLLAATLQHGASAGRGRVALLAGAAALIGLGNTAVLIAPSRGEVMAETAAAAIDAAGAGGLVVSLDRFQHYAVLREQPGCEVHDAHDLAIGYGPDAAPELRAGLSELLSRRDAALARGGSVVLTRDRWLAQLFYRDELLVQPALIQALTANLEREERRDATGEITAIVLKRP
jgi:hypothetical protein